MSSLAFVGIFSVAALTYTLFVLLIETPFYYNQWHNKPLIETRAVVLDWNIFTSCSLVFFAYTCQMSIMPVYSELVKPNYRRIKKVIIRALLTDFIFYLLISNAGYFSQFNNTNDVVIVRPTLDGYSPDYTNLAAAFAICIVLFAAFPSNYNPCRNQFFLLFYNEPNFSNKANFVVTLIFVIVTCSVAIFYPNVSSVLSIMGGLCSVSICYTVPLYAWVKLSDKPWFDMKNLAPILFFGVLIISGYSSVIATVYMIITG